jgi:membrane-associated phospholipid phosphatase
MIQALQAMSPVLDSFCRFFSFLATPAFLLLLIGVIYWTVDSRIDRNTLFVLLTSALLSLVLQQLLHQPRPYWLGDVLPLTTQPTYSLPCTYTCTSLAVLGYLAYRLDKEWLWAATALSAALIGFSQLYLGVQTLLGVLSGWLLGLGVVFLFLYLEESSWRRGKELSAERQVGAAFAASLLVIVIGWGVGLAIARSPDPAGWAAYAARARSLSGYFIIAGGLFGAACGRILGQGEVRVVCHGRGNLLRKTAGCLVGFAGLLLIYAIFAWLISRSVVLALLFGYTQAALLAIWLLCGAPWIFGKVNLSSRKMR